MNTITTVGALESSEDHLSTVWSYEYDGQKIMSVHVLENPPKGVAPVVLTVYGSHGYSVGIHSEAFRLLGDLYNDPEFQETVNAASL